jgi:hypothetical protein
MSTKPECVPRRRRVSPSNRTAEQRIAVGSVAFAMLAMTIGCGSRWTQQAAPENPMPTLPIPSIIPPVPLPSDIPTVPLPSDVPTVKLPNDIPRVQLPSDIPRVGLPADIPRIQLPSDIPPIPFP